MLIFLLMQGYYLHRLPFFWYRSSFHIFLWYHVFPLLRPLVTHYFFHLFLTLFRFCCILYLLLLLKSVLVLQCYRLFPKVVIDSAGCRLVTAYSTLPIPLYVSLHFQTLSLHHLLFRSFFVYMVCYVCRFFSNIACNSLLYFFLTIPSYTSLEFS